MAYELVQSVQGTEDVLPGQWAYWRRLDAVARALFERYGYAEIRTPAFEDTRLFVRGTGETTDIVEKEMYTIPTGDGGSITLRPEGTPAVVRSYLEHNLHKQEAFRKLYYAGPMFRHERPQRGRLRQFYQLGVEAIGSGCPFLDAETIILTSEVFRGVGLSGFGVVLNSMGCAACRPKLRADLRARLAERLGELCDDCRRRMDRNPFRVLDCKNEGCRGVTASLPPMTEGLCRDCTGHYATVKATLAAAGIAHTEEPRLVRGLDYYTRTVFEVRHGGLGARDAICGGGRYDGLVELLGGPSLPCVGFAIGVEPTLLAMESELGPAPATEVRPAAYVVCFAEEARRACFDLVQQLRRGGVAAETDFERRSPKAQMRAANKLGVRLCLLVGPDELARGEVTLKDMADGSQCTVSGGAVLAEVLSRARTVSGETQRCSGG